MNLYTDCRCKKSSHYTIQIHSTLGEYVLANKYSVIEEYDPFTRISDILLSLLMIGYHYRQAKNISLEVAQFCMDYGFLGFGKAMVQKVYDSGRMKLHLNNVLGKKALEKDEMEKYTVPFPKERNKQRRRTPQVYPVPEPPEPAFIELDYEYGEQVAWYGIYGSQLYGFMEKLATGEPFDFQLGNAELFYHCENGLMRPVWKFDALKTACDIAFANILTMPSPEIRLCKHCGKPFTAHGTRAEYCSISCRNVTNVKSSRQRKGQLQHT